MLIPHVFLNYSLRGLKYLTKICDGFKSRCCIYVFKRNMNSKPPNIFVLTEHDCPKLFKNIEGNLLQCLQTHSYLVYHLLLSEVTKQPWMENTMLLVVSCEEMDDSVAAALDNYIHNSGRILLVCSKFKNRTNNECAVVQAVDRNKLIQIDFKEIGTTFVYRGKYSYCFIDSTVVCYDSHNTPVIHKKVSKEGTLIASEVYLDRDCDILPEDLVLSKYDRDKRLMILKCILTEEFGLKTENKEPLIPQFSPGYFISDKESLDMGITDDLNLNACSDKLVFCEYTLKCTGTQTKLPIYFTNESTVKSLGFDKTSYFTSLNTDIFGHNLVYFPVTSSTMEVAEQLFDYDGIVIVASCQINGKGRGGNKWISPMGCAMFTLFFTLPLFSNLGRKLPLIQHIAAVAVVHGIRNQQQYKELNIKLKWPNDIYFGTNKIGGLIVSSKVEGSLAYVSIGWGINVANDRPTSCLNSAIDEYNLENSCTLPYLCVEEVIGVTISQIEYLIKEFEKSGPDKFLFHYYSYWMHNLQNVTLVNLNERGTITGIDEYGFLNVNTEKGKQITLQPDGNRFDVMRNLIHTKE